MYKYIYICENSKDQKYYCGKHETDDLGDNYLGSAGSAEYDTDNSDGLIKAPKKIYYHDDSQVILACEHFLILSLKNVNWKLYNKNSGGGGKGKIDIALVPDNFRELVSEIIETGVIPDNEYKTADNQIAKEVYKKFKQNKYGSSFETLADILDYEVWQPRSTHLDSKHVDSHKSGMLRDLSEYFTTTDPVVILDNDIDGLQYKVEGNHRIEAARQLDLKKFPIAHIPFSEFNHSWTAVTAFCNKLNFSTEIKKDLTAEDLRMQIAQMSTQYPDLDIHSDQFEKQVYGTFSEEYSSKQLSSNLRIFRENALEDKKKSERNFYSPGKKDLEEAQKEILINAHFRDACVISVASNAIMHSGAGAILHKLSENKNKKQGIIVTRHMSTDDEDNVQNYIDHFQGTLREAGFVSSNGIVFKNPHNNKKIKLFILPCRRESTKVGMRYWNSYKAAFDAIK